MISTCEKLQYDLKTSKKDNVKLYERIKYLESHTQNKIILRKRDLESQTMGQYKTLYEQSIDPFQEFTKLQKLKKIDQLTQLDQVVYYISKFVLSGPRVVRLVGVSYVLIIHI